MLHITYISNPLLEVPLHGYHNIMIRHCCCLTLWLMSKSFEHIRHLFVVFETGEASGPEKTEYSNINWSELRGYKSEVDCLQERPNKHTDLKILVKEI